MQNEKIINYSIPLSRLWELVPFIRVSRRTHYASNCKPNLASTFSVRLLSIPKRSRQISCGCIHYLNAHWRLIKRLHLIVDSNCFCCYTGSTQIQMNKWKNHFRYKFVEIETGKIFGSCKLRFRNFQKLLVLNSAVKHKLISR